MISDLPMDLLEEILSRVPAASLKRLRSTCKLWHTLFKNRGFRKKHFHKAAKESLVLMLKNTRVCTMSVNLNVDAPSIDFKDALSLKDPCYNSDQVDIFDVFHCDGLLLCTTTNKRLVVWNPCLGETRWIQLKHNDKRIFRFTLGYQNNKSCRTYKILRYWYCFDPYVVSFEIYEFSSYSWRVLDIVSEDYFIYTNSGVSLKGNTYWLALENEYNILLSFDFTTERLQRLCLPKKYDKIVLSVVKEEQLSVLHLNYATSEIEIWILINKIDSEAEWRKSFKVNSKICSDSLRLFMTILVDEEKKVVVVCCMTTDYTTNGNMVKIIGEEDEYYTEVSSLEFKDSCWPIIFNYVPSLVQII